MVAGRTREILGRAGELATLSAAADAARSGHPTVVVVEGEPGIGKSRLVAEATERLRVSGAVVGIGRGVDLAGGALPYGVVGGLVRSLRAAVGTERLVSVLGEARAGALGSLDPTLAVAGGDLLDRNAVFEAVQHMMSELARDQLVCLVLEDLQWADPSSVDLITFLAATASGQLLVLATTRLEGTERLARLVAIGELLTLRPLSDQAARDLATAGLSTPLDEQTLAQIVALGEGIPLYVEELVALQSASRSGIPSGLVVSFTTRLGGVSDEGRQLLEAVAVAEGEVPVESLRKALRAKRSAVADALTEVESRGLLDVGRDGRVRFHHELLRRALADAMSPLVRMQWHRRWAVTLEQLDRHEQTDPVALAKLAHHWFHAGDVDHAVPAAVGAGRAGASTGAATEAAVHWYRALLHWRRAHDAAGTAGLSHEAALVEGTTVMRLAGAYEDLQEVLTAERARTAVGDDALRLWLDLGLAHAATRLGEVRAHVLPRDRLAEVLDQLSGEPPGPIVRATLFSILWEFYDADPLLVERVVDVLDAHIDPATSPRDARALRIRRARFSLDHGDAEKALELVREVLADESAFQRTDRPVAESLEIGLLYVLGRFGESVEVGERALARIGNPEIAGMNWSAVADNLACAHAMIGNPQRAEELIRTILASGDPVMHAMTACDLVDLLARLGREQEAADLLAEVRAQELPGPGTAGYRFGLSSQIPAAGARVAAARGDVHAARDLLRPVLADPNVTIDSQYLWGLVLDAGRLFDDPPALEPLADREAWVGVVQDAAARVHRYGSLGSVWPADFAAHVDRALERDTAEQWRSVVDGWESLGAPTDAALARLRLAERLAVNGQREQAVAELTSALATAKQLGAMPLLQLVQAAARRHRLRLGGVEHLRDASSGLTARELEVLALLAEGRTNEQVAATLFMSPKTASVHVSRIIAKLAVANRTEAAAYAHRHGLV